MIKKIVGVKDPCLRNKSKPVKKIDKKVKSLIKDLKDTLLAQKDPEGVGLAAPQVGKNVQIFAMNYDSDLQIFINPKILSIKNAKTKRPQQNEEKIMEGCLSLPHYYSPLARPGTVEVEYLTESGKKVKETYTGFKAQIIQHEVDHLSGILFIDRLIEQKMPLYELVDDQWQEVELI